MNLPLPCPDKPLLPRSRRPLQPGVSGPKTGPRRGTRWLHPASDRIISSPLSPSPLPPGPILSLPLFLTEPELLLNLVLAFFRGWNVCLKPILLTSFPVLSTSCFYCLFVLSLSFFYFAFWSSDDNLFLLNCQASVAPKYGTIFPLLLAVKLQSCALILIVINIINLFLNVPLNVLTLYGQCCLYLLHLTAVSSFPPVAYLRPFTPPPHPLANPISPPIATIE